MNNQRYASVAKGQKPVWKMKKAYGKSDVEDQRTAVSSGVPNSMNAALAAVSYMGWPLFLCLDFVSLMGFMK